MGKIITFKSEARSKILSGMIEAKKAVTSTLGPKGHTVVLNNGTNHPTVTKDGVSVLDFIDFTDPYKNMGVNFVKDSVRKVNNECGDGSTTTTLLSVELCEAGNELIERDFDAVDVKRGFQKASKDVIKVLEKNKKSIESEEDILKVATISANNDPEVGQIITDAFLGVGEDGVVIADVAHNRKGETSITFSSGFEIPRGYVSSCSVNSDNDTVKYVNPQFFVYGKKIENLKDIQPIFQIAKGDLVIVAPSYSDDFISLFIENVSSGRFNATIIGPAGASREAMDDNLVDIAKVTGATIVEGKLGKSIDSFNAGYFGSAENFTASSKKVNILGGKGNPEELEKHIQSIKALVEKGKNGTDAEALSEYELNYYNERIASLSGGVAIIWIGGFTDAEVKEKKDRFEDAINAVRTAINDGILAGGGAGLLHAVKEVADSHIRIDNATEEAGYQKFLKVMEVPARTIIASTGKDPGYWSEKIKESNDSNFGYNAKAEELCNDMYNTGIIDPVRVEIMAIQYSTSLAGTFITTDCVITSDAFNCSVAANDEILDKDRSMFNE